MKAIGNTILYVAILVPLGCLVNSIAAFAFTVFDFPFKKLIFGLFLMSFMIPFESIAIPLYSLVNKLGLVNTRTAMIAHSMWKTVILDPSPVPPEPLPEELLRNIDIPKPNITELLALAPKCNSIHKAAEHLLVYGSKYLLVTLGSKGSILYTKGRDAQSFPAATANVVDTIAAGDSFVGAFAVALSQYRSLEDCISFASQVASVTIGRCGAQSSIPSLDEISL